MGLERIERLKLWLPIVWVVSLFGCAGLAKIDAANLFSRSGWQHPDRVVDTLELRGGEHIADIGAGDGYFTFWLAEAVGPTGRVYAVDVDEDSVRELRREVERRGIENIEVILAREDDPLLPDTRIDWVFVCNAYHHIDDRVEYFRRLHGKLMPESRLAILEGRDDWLSKLVAPAGHSTPIETLQSELATAGFENVAGYEFLPFQSFGTYRREPTLLNPSKTGS